MSLGNYYKLGQKLVMNNIIVKTVVFVSTLLLPCFASIAQDIDGISLWDVCTKEQLAQKFGQPLNYYSEDDLENGGIIEELTFKDLWIRLDGRKVTSFAIRNDSKVRALTKTIKGGVALGQSPNSLSSIGGRLFETKTKEDGTIVYCYLFGDDSFYVNAKNGKIIKIWAQALVM